MGLIKLLSSTTLGIGDNRVRAEGGAMLRLDDTAVDEALQYLGRWQRRGNQVAAAAEAPAAIPTSTSAGTRSSWLCPAMPRVT
jgi:hypothetical protein